MNITQEEWEKRSAGGELSIEEMERSMFYMHDLIGGQNAIKGVKQGVDVFGSARTKEGNPDYEKARELGQKLAKAGQVVVTGGGPGIMEAANRGAFEAGGESIGLNIKLPFEQELNPYTTKSYTFNYFFARKTMFLDACKAYVYFPGGFGTLDEFSEAITLIQTKKLNKRPIVFYDSEFWTPFFEFVHDKMLNQGLISPEDEQLYTITDNLDEIVQICVNTPEVEIGDAVTNVDQGKAGIGEGLA